jgi:excisionase family DNA binding protein
VSDQRPYPPDYVSAETLAYRLDCSRSTIDQYVKAGLLPKPILLGNLVRWDFAAVKAYIEARHNGELRDGEEDEFLRAVRNGANKPG